MPRQPEYETLEQALDHATELLAERFEKPDQMSAVMLAQALYTIQERERFEVRGREQGGVPYRS